MNKKNRLILIDGSAYIFRAYYGLPSMNGRNGDLVIKYEVEKELKFTKNQIKLITEFFPMDKFNVEDCEDIKAVDPESFQNQSSDEGPQGHPGVQCAQQ